MKTLYPLIFIQALFVFHLCHQHMVECELRAMRRRERELRVMNWLIANSTYGKLGVTIDCLYARETALHTADGFVYCMGSINEERQRRGRLR